MKVIVASFPKCGTKTLHRALDILGYKVHDFDDQVYHHQKEWMNIVTYGSDKNVLQRMYKDVDAICDFPGGFYWEELSEAFPEAKVILTMRSSEDDWYESYARQVEMMCSSYLLRMFHVLTPSGRGTKALWDQTGHVAFSCPAQPYTKWLQNPNPQIQKRRYREHNASVLQRVPKEKLLVMNLSEGWESLCKFLGKDVPDVPFPHENAKGVLVASIFDLQLYRQIAKELQIIVSVFILIVALIICYLCFM